MKYFKVKATAAVGCPGLATFSQDIDFSFVLLIFSIPNTVFTRLT